MISVPNDEAGQPEEQTENILLLKSLAASAPYQSPGEIVTYKAEEVVGGPVAEFLEWTTLTIASGVLGNSVYDVLKRAIKGFAGRFIDLRTMTKSDALRLSRAAMETRCMELELPEPKFARMEYAVHVTSRRRWLFHFFEQDSGREFLVRLPRNRATQKAIKIDIYFPSKQEDVGSNVYLGRRARRRRAL